MNNPPDSPSKTPEASGPDPEQVARWVAAARRGDQDAFGELVRSHHERVYAVIYRMVQQAEDARELAQLTWVKAWQRLDTYKQESQFFTWLYRIAINTAMDEIRRRTRRKEVSLDASPVENPRPSPDWHPAEGARPDQALEQEEVRRVFHEALGTLKPEHKAALILREVQGLSYREIAEVTKCRIGTVMSRIFYARRTIQERMKELR